MAKVQAKVKAKPKVKAISPPRKKRARTARKTKKRSAPLIDPKKLVYTLFLLVMFLFSVGVLGYVIFFRTVIAAEIENELPDGLVFEEPHYPVVNTQKKGPADKVSNPRCAIIIDDMGYHGEIGRNLINLPMDLSFAFLPHAPFTSELEKMAYEKGKTVLLHFPLQPKDSSWDPGPGAMFLDNLDNLSGVFQNNLDLVPHAVGINNHMGSLYTENRRGMRLLLELIAPKKLFFLDSYTTSKSVGLETAKEMGVASARRHLFLDNVLTTEEICSQLYNLVSMAEQQGEAIGIAHPHQETLNALSSCMDLVKHPVQLVSVEELMR